MKLPLADEVRVARAAADRARRASLDLAEVNAAVALLPIRKSDPVWRASVRAIAARWEVAVTDDDPTLLKQARRVLAAIAAEFDAAALALHDLQHEQRHLLETPEFDTVRTEIAAMYDRLGHLDHHRAPLEQRRAVLEPTDVNLAGHLASLHEGSAGRAAALLRVVVGDLRRLLDVVEVSVAVPSVDLPQDVDWDTLAPVEAALRSTHLALAELLAQTKAELATLDAEHQQLNGTLLAWLG